MISATELRRLAGSTLTLFPYPLREMAEIGRELGYQIYFDGAHQLGLIAAGKFQDPLREGAIILTGSTGKTLSGPQGGIILWDDEAITERVRWAIFPGLAATHQINRVAALAVSLAEMLEFGQEYMAQIVANAKALGQALDERGFDVLCAHKGYTETHQVAVSVSQIDPLPHQLEAVYHYMLRHPRVRFLLADDAGAGKTIMAGLLLKEFKYRGIVERTLVVTPANLTDQWQREMRDKFGEEFTVVNRATLEAFYGESVWEARPQCIASVDFAKQDDVLDSLRGVRWDLVIVDEAHKMAAYQYGQKVKKTERYHLGELLSERADHLLFLTATPHKGDPENFLLLLELLDPDLYASTEILRRAVQRQENPIFLRRTKEDMVGFDGKPLFPPRHAQTVGYKLSPVEKELYEAVTRYVENHFQRAFQEENRNVQLALTVLQRRLASSLRAIRKSLENRRNRLQEVQRLGRLLLEEPREIREEDLEDLPEVDRWHIEDEAVARLGDRDMPGTRLHAEREFRDPQGAQIMVATEAAGEGINLQFCHLMVNWDIPWNPNRLEQRMGRVHRYGQTQEVFIYNLVASDTREGSVLEALLNKLEAMRKDLGDRVYDVVGELVEGVRLEQLFREALARRRSFEEIRQEVEARLDETAFQRIQEAALEGLATRHIDLSRLRQEADMAREHRLVPEYIERFFVEAFQELGGTVERRSDGLWWIEWVPARIRSLPPEVERRFGKVAQTYRQFTFCKPPSSSQGEGRGGGRAEFVAPGHPLFEAVVHHVLAEYGPASQDGAVFLDPEGQTEGVLWFLRGEVRDGQGETVGERLFAAFEPLYFCSFYSEEWELPLCRFCGKI